MMYGQPGAVARADGQARGDRGPRSSKCRSRPGSAAVQAFQTPGSAWSAPRTTGTRSCRTPGGSSRALAPSGVPRIHFGVGTGELLGLLGEAGATWSAWTGGSPSTRPRAGSAPLPAAQCREPGAGGGQRPCRATLTRPCCSPARTWWSPGPARSSAAPGAQRPHLQPGPWRPPGNRPGHPCPPRGFRPRGLRGRCLRELAQAPRVGTPSWALP